MCSFFIYGILRLIILIIFAEYYAIYRINDN